MKKLFLPAEALMNRLSYPIKFGLLGLLVTAIFASLMLCCDVLNTVKSDVAIWTANIKIKLD